MLIRGPGTGKSHIATALGVQAIEHHRKKVSFFSTVDLVNALEQEKAANWAGQLADRLLRLDLVILDELAAWFQQIDGERIDVIKTPFLAMWNDAVAKEVAGDTTFPSRQIGDATQTFVMSGMSARASHFEHLLGHVLGLYVLGLHVLGLYVLALDVARLGGVLAIDPTGRAMICVPRMWLASWIRLTGGQHLKIGRGPGCFRPAGSRADQPMATHVCGHGGRQDAGDGGDGAIQRQFHPER